MKNPLWIINSTLVALLGILCFLLFLLKGTPGRRESLVPHEIAPLPQNNSIINPVRIYENDLFRTYVKPIFQKDVPTERVVNPPAPPQDRNFIKRPQSSPEFLPPLDVELKGIIFNSNRLRSRIIVINKKTKQEHLYKIGDIIEDAQIIYIDKNKAIFVRSNGQQEALFINAQAAQEDPFYEPHVNPHIIEKINDSSYLININQFTKEITSVAQFLNMLDITTAFDKGNSIGCHIGKVIPKSIGALLGLHQGDIIVNINGIPTSSTTDRVAIYNQLEKSANNDQITVKLLRNGISKEYTYTLQRQKKNKQPAASNFQKIQEVSEQTISQTKTNNGIADILKNNDRQKMVEYGGRNNLLQR